MLLEYGYHIYSIDWHTNLLDSLMFISYYFERFFTECSELKYTNFL